MASLFSWLAGARMRFAVAFGDRFLLAARLTWRGRRWLAAEVLRQELPEGLLAPSAVDLNIRSVSDLARLAGEALAKVGCRGARLGLLLPDLATRGFVLPAGPRGTEVEILESLAARLPYPRPEAVIDTWRGGSNSILAAAIRRQILHQYEHTFEALGCRPSVVVGASMAPLPDWTRAARSAAGLIVGVQLYPRHYTLSVFRGGELVDVRLKLASDGAGQILEEIGRLPTFYEGAVIETLSFSGERAREVYERAMEARLAPGRPELGEDGEEAHLAALLPAVASRI